MHTFVESERILLRFIEKEDDDFLYELNSDPEVMKFLTDGKPNTKKEIDGNMQRILDRRIFYKDKYGDFVGIFKKTGEPFAWFCLRPPHDDIENYNLIEIGWRLKKKFWKMGLATEAATLLLEKAFKNYKVPVVFAKTMANNYPSRKVMERLNLKFLKNYQEDLFPGTNKDAVWYEINNPGDGI
jgi:RimJ/RimL family protein N-acetyltransferase